MKIFTLKNFRLYSIFSILRTVTIYIILPAGTDMETRRIQNIKQRDEMLKKLGFKKVQCLT